MHCEGKKELPKIFTGSTLDVNLYVLIITPTKSSSVVGS